MGDGARVLSKMGAAQPTCWKVQTCDVVYSLSVVCWAIYVCDTTWNDVQLA